MHSRPVALLIAVMMLATSLGANFYRMSSREIDVKPAVSLSDIVPRQFSEWYEEPTAVLQVVNPQARTLVDTVYSQILERTYVNADGYRIMLSIAYASDQRNFRAHYPEACYAAAGFVLHRRELGELATPFGTIPVGRLFTSHGSRQEPLIYWAMLGDKAALGWKGRLAELEYALAGSVPEGLIFRVSSIDGDQEKANKMQERFIHQMLKAVSTADRERLSGLRGS